MQLTLFVEEERVMHSRSDGIKFTSYNEANVFHKVFDSQEKINQCHHMGNGCFHQFPTVRENATKHYVLGKAWEIDTHTFPIVWVLFCH